MGLLPEINRAYMIMDNRLFLWNYIDARSLSLSVYVYLCLSVCLSVVCEVCRSPLDPHPPLPVWNVVPSSDVVHFEQSNEAIVTVGLVRPVPDVFSEDVHHLLVIATASEVSLVAIRLTDLSPNMSEIRLLPSFVTYSCPPLCLRCTLPPLTPLPFFSLRPCSKDFTRCPCMTRILTP